MIVPITVLFLWIVIIPVLLAKKNLALYKSLPKKSKEFDPGEKISILVPVRNEEMRIAFFLERIEKLENRNFELLILDDHSTDSTVDILEKYKERIPEMRVCTSRELPSGWNGKMHACFQLSELASFDVFVFVDADVLLEVDFVDRVLAWSESYSNVSLLSVFPKQITETLSEKMLIPMMHYLLISYLPIELMRKTSNPVFSAGCGQLMIARKDAYIKCGGHSAIASSRHDGVSLPRAFRERAFMTDIASGFDIASTRMYIGWKEVVDGLLKNASEGIAHPKRIGIFGGLLLGGSVLPWVLFVLFYRNQASSGYVWVMYAAMGLISFLPMFWIKRRLHLSWLSVLLHPINVLIFVVIQIYATWNFIIGKRLAWRGRVET